MNKRISLVLVLALVFSLIQPVWSMRLALASGDMVKPADKDVYFDNDGSHVSGEDIGALIGGGPLYVNFVGPDSEYGNQRTMINFADLDSDLPTTISSVTMRLFIPYVFVHTNAPYDAVVTVNASNITNWEADSVSDFPADNNDPLLDHLQNIRVATKKNNGMNNEDTVDLGNVDTTSTGCTPIPGVLLGCLNLDVTDYVKNKISGGAADVTFLLSGATLQTTSAYFTIYPNENETYKPQLIFAGETAPAPAQTAEAGAQTLTPVAGADNTVTLTVKDSLGNVDTSFAGSHSVTISGVEPSPNGTYGSFAGTALDASAAGGGQAISATFANGVATAALALHQAEAQTIGFSIAGVATPATNSLTITPKAAALAALTLSQDMTAPSVNGGTFVQQPVVNLVDAYGNLVSTDSSTQVTASKKDAGSWTLTGAATVTANAGVATFSGLGAANAAEVNAAQLAFNSGALTEITSTPITLPAPAAAQTAEAGAQTLTPIAGADNTVTLTVKDSLGNVDTSFTGSHSVTISGVEPSPNGTYGSFAGTALDASASGAGQAIGVTFTDGVATAALALNKAEAQTIGFSIADVATSATNSLTITPTTAALAALTLSQDITAPSVNGGTFAQQPVVKLVDAYGNLVSTDSSTQVTASKKDAGSWTLTGTATVTANAGVVTFSGLGAMNAAEVNGAQLAFRAGALAEITSTPVTLPAPAAAQTAEAGAQTLTPVAGADNTVTLTVKDSLGNVDTSFTGTYSVTINGAEPSPNGTYGTFAGTALDASAAGAGQSIDVTFTDGVATAALALNKAEAQTIGFSIAGVATPATNSLTITPKAGALAALTLSQDVTAPPVNGGVFAQQPVVKLVDAYGNLVSTDSSTQVTASKKDAGSWTLTGTATVTANAGVATFSGLGAANAAEVNAAQLAFHAGALAEITSTPVTLPAPAAAQTAEAGAQTLTPVAGADNTVTLTVKDSLGNVDTSFTGTYSVTINGAEPSPNGTYGTFAGTALDASAAGAGQSIDVTFTDGVATAALALNKAEAQTIGFSIAGVATPATNSLTITPKAGALAALTLSQDVTAPPVNGGAFAQQPVVKLVDAYGNLVSTDSSTQVTVSRKDAGSWTLTGTVTVTASAGIATFSGLGAANAAEVSGAQLAFHAGALPEITSTAVMLPAPALAQTAEAGAQTLTPVAGADNIVTLTVKDSLGNVDTSFTGTHSVTINGAKPSPNGTYGTFAGTALDASAAGAGQSIDVTFTNGAATAALALNKAESQTISFSIAGVATPATNSLTIMPKAGALTALTLSQDVTAPPVNGGAFAQQPVVKLVDAYGNLVSTDSSTQVTVSRKDAGSWTLTGKATVTANAGVATFSGLGAVNAVEVSGAQLAFHAGGLQEITSSKLMLLWPDPTAPVLTLLEVKDQSVTIGWEPVYGSVTYSVYQRTGNEIYIDPTMTVAGSVYNATITGLINGITYSFVIKASHPGGASGFSNEVSATPSTVPASPTNVTAVAGNGQATISFTIPADDGGSPITAYEVTASPGNVVITGTSSPITITGLTNGTSYTFTVKAVNGAGSSASSAESNVVRPVAPSRNNHNSSPSSPSTPSSQTDTPSQTETTDVGVNVFVNGKVENAGTATISQMDNQTVTTIAVDQKKLDDKLAAEGQGALVTIPLNTKSDVVVGELTGQMVKNMEDKQAVLQIKTDQASYTLPANQINIGSVSAQIGTSVALSDIKVQIEIAAPAADTVKVVENAAKQGTFMLVVPPVEFTVRAVHGDKTIEVTKFNAYVERTIAIPDGVDPSKITTGVVVDPDGTVRHVPTKVVQMEGKYYAVINSLTNSTYSVVWHPITFSDVANHWSKDAVNDMGSRMVINGTGEDTFSPDRDITRAEFAAIIVRGLGLRLEKGVAPFSDVKESDWYSGAIKTAYEYHLINGFEDGTFHPMDNITREQAMVILSEAMRLTELKAKLEPKAAEETLRAFTDDSSASPWAADGIADSVEAGIVSGREGMQLAPKAFITRAEVAAMIKRLLQNSGLI